MGNGEGSVRVEARHSLGELAPLVPALRELNLASRRPALFDDPAYLATLLAHDEYAVPGAEPLLLLAFDGPALVGFLPLRRRPERILGLRCTRIEFLVLHDTERPRLVARPGDEARCAEAFYRHLLEVERGWTFAEFIEQDAASGLYPPPASVSPSRFYVRRFPTNPNATIPLAGVTFEGWYRSLKKDHRRNAQRRTRMVADLGELEFVTSDDVRGAPALLDLYLDVEARSWKQGARAGISRHPERIAFFRQLMTAGQPGRPLFHFLLVDGLPIAAALDLTFEGVVYCMEVAFDEAYRDAGPGHPLFLLGIRDYVGRGAREVNLLTNFEYYKSRWGAVVTETSAVQLFRRFSLHHLKAIAGEQRRRLGAGAPSQREAKHNLTRADSDEESGAEQRGVAAVDREPSRALAAATLSRLAADGVSIDRLAGAALVAALPFEAARKKVG